MKKYAIRILLILIFILGLIYILTPVPGSVDNFSPLSGSFKSREVGDTTQSPNIAAYFSQHPREEINKFYKQEFRSKFLFGNFLPSIVLNYPPQYAQFLVREQITSTFLEEHVYPLKGSLFVNGYEPAIENQLKKKKSNFLGDHIHINGNFYVSKATIKYYPSLWYIRLPIYISIWFALILIWKLSVKIAREKL